MHHLTCGISSHLHSVNLILFTLLLVHLILCISPHYSHHFRSHYLSLSRPFTPDLKLICFTNQNHVSVLFYTLSITDRQLIAVKSLETCNSHVLNNFIRNGVTTKSEDFTSDLGKKIHSRLYNTCRYIARPGAWPLRHAVLPDNDYRLQIITKTKHFRW